MINTRLIAKEYRLEHWAQVMRERNESGTSIRAYCESVGLHENVYYYWQRKLREVAAQAIEITPQATLSAPQGWAVCKSSPKSNAEYESGNISIEIGKARVSVSKDADQTMLTNICRMLVGLC
jgi:transposase-like protein